MDSGAAKAVPEALLLASLRYAVVVEMGIELPAAAFTVEKRSLPGGGHEYRSIVILP